MAALAEEADDAEEREHYFDPIAKRIARETIIARVETEALLRAHEVA